MNDASLPHYRAPRSCPVCSERLQVTQLGCAECGTLISGAFTSCDFCALTEADRQMLGVFLASRGNLREVAKHLGVSAPTARSRYDELVARLGIAPNPEPGDASAPEDEPTAAAPTTEPGEDPRLAALRALADGRLDVDATRTMLGGD